MESASRTTQACPPAQSTPSGKAPKRRHSPLPGPAMIVVDPDGIRGTLLAEWFAARHDARVLAVVHSAASAAAALSAHRVDIVCLDPDLPDGCGMALLRRLPHERLPVAAMVLTSGPGLAKARREPPPAKACAVVDRAEGFEKVVIEFGRLLSGAGLASPANLVDGGLSPRETDVFLLIGQGLANAQIAARLGMSQMTAETHRKAITRKLGVTGAGLVRRAALHVATSAAALAPPRPAVSPSHGDQSPPRGEGTTAEPQRPEARSVSESDSPNWRR